MTTRIVGASVWEQRVYDHLVSHVENERETLQAYAALADRTTSPAFAFLARLILDDERRHHQLLGALAESLRAAAELKGGPTPVPDLDLFGADCDEIIEETERFLAVEEDDQRELRDLARELRGLKDTTLWHLVVRLIQDDNEKHRRILGFVRDRAREAAARPL